MVVNTMKLIQIDTSKAGEYEVVLTAKDTDGRLKQLANLL